MLRFHHWPVLLIAFVLSVGMLPGQAQMLIDLMPVDPPVTPPTDTLCDTDEARLLWSGVNEYRRQSNLLPLALNPTLCQIAQDHIYDLASRPANHIGNQEVRMDDTFLDNWLQEDDYQPYFNNEYVADIRVFINPDLPPRETTNYPAMLEYLYNHHNSEKLYHLTLNASYREIGIGYYETAQHYLYVFIFGAQPSVLPIIPVNPDREHGQRYEYAYEWSAPEIGLLIHDENYAPAGSPPDRIGQVTHVQVSDISRPFQSCPDKNATLPPDWQSFPITQANPLRYALSGNQGLNSIYVRSCDARLAQAVQNSVQINYTGGVPITPTTTPTNTPTPTMTPDLALTQTIRAEQATLNAYETRIAEVDASETQDAQTRLTETATAATSVIIEATEAERNLSNTPAASSPETLTPMPTATILNDVPEVRLLWNNQFFVIHHTGNQPEPLSKFSQMRFVDPETDGTYAGSSAITEALEAGLSDFPAGHCIVVDNPGDAVVIDETDVFRLYEECRTDTGLFALTVAQPGTYIWSDTEDFVFTVRFAGRDIQECRQTECQLWASYSLIFISYADDDEDFGRCFTEELEAAGYNPWLRAKDLAPGENIPQKSRDVLDSAAVYIVIMTQRSLYSSQVQAELEQAIQQGLPVIPVLYREDVFPDLQNRARVDMRSYDCNNLVLPERLTNRLQEFVSPVPVETQSSQRDTDAAANTWDAATIATVLGTIIALLSLILAAWLGRKKLFGSRSETPSPFTDRPDNDSTR